MTGSKPNDSELLFGDWLLSQGCHALYVNQDTGFTADLPKRARAWRPIHRPDFLALVDGAGTLAFDVKGYDFDVRETRWFNGDYYDTPEDVVVSFVRLIWNEVIELYEFQKASNIPTWICFIDRKQRSEPKRGWFYRVDIIYETYSRLFISRELGLIPVNAGPLSLFDDWPPLEVEKRPMDTYPSPLGAFDFIVDDNSNLLSQSSSLEAFLNFYVPPVLLNLWIDSTVANLIDLQHVQATGVRGRLQQPTPIQIAAVERIKAKSPELPPVSDRLAYHNYIERHRQHQP